MGWVILMIVNNKPFRNGNQFNFSKKEKWEQWEGIWLQLQKREYEWFQRDPLHLVIYWHKIISYSYYPMVYTPTIIKLIIIIKKKEDWKEVVHTCKVVVREEGGFESPLLCLLLSVWMMYPSASISAFNFYSKY